jgi:hypothetical protein
VGPATGHLVPTERSLVLACRLYASGLRDLQTVCDRVDKYDTAIVGLVAQSHLL